MELTGERIIAADRASVWKALNDPEVLKACIPGCERMEWTGDNALEAEVTQKVGPVKAKFKGAVTLEDVVEAESYRIVGEGKGGAAGFAKGGAAVSLTDDEGGTKLSYNAEAKVGGKLAQLGSRLITGFARKMADEFFDRFKAEVEGGGAGAAEAAEAAEEEHVPVATPSTAVPEEMLGQPAPSAPPTKGHEAAFQAALPDGSFEGDEEVATPSSATPEGTMGEAAPSAPPTKGHEAAFQAALPDGSFEGDEAVATPSTATPAETKGAAAPSAPPADPSTAAPETPHEAAETKPAAAAAPKPAPEPEKKKSWFQRLFG